MYTVKTKEEFLEDLRSLDKRLKNIRISSIEISKKEQSVTYNFICDEVVDEELKSKILDQVDKITDKTFKSVKITVKKIVSNPQLVNAEIVKFFKDNYPSISIFLKPTDVYSENSGEQVRFTVRLNKGGEKYVKNNGAMQKLNEYLSRKFCSEFVGVVEEKEEEESIDLTSETVFKEELEKVERRTIKVKDVIVIDDISMGDTALYIEDLNSGEGGEAVVCGTVLEIREKLTKSGKPFFIFTIDDTTGVTSGVYFTKKNTYNTVKGIKEGECIIAGVRVGEYNGRPSVTIDRINRCTFPEDFVKKDKFKKKPPREYSLVFPESATTMKVSSVFSEEQSIPEEVLSNEYVVFDLETTGLEVANCGITEIGAVKIKGGKITEQFTTLVKPDCPIPMEVVKVTGITEDLVKDAPKISAVMPDFMKFVEGAVLIAHNAPFDVGIMKRFASAEEYDLKNKVIDTVYLARQKLPTLPRFDLHTVAEHFNIVFHHHRALSDAYATAEAFIEMMKLK